MSSSSTLSYAAPQTDGISADTGWVLGPAILAATASGAAAIEIAVAVLGPQQDWNSYIGPEFSMIIDIVAHLVLFSAMAGILICVIACIRWLMPRFKVRDSFLLWAILGVVYGLACTVPHAIDVALTGNGFDDGGSLTASGLGNQLQMVVYFLFPIATLLWCFTVAGKACWKSEAQVARARREDGVQEIEFVR